MEIYSTSGGSDCSDLCLACCRILDNLPVAMVKMRKDESSNTLVKTYERGFPVGFKASLEVRCCS
jgi:hypothetical protein